VALAQVKYGALQLSAHGVETEGSRLGQPVDDVLALLDEPERLDQRVYQLLAWGVFGLLGDLPPATDAERESVAGLDLVALFGERATRLARTRVRRMARDGTPEAVLRAARQAAKGKLDPWLAPHLARITFSQGGGPDDVPDLLALVAWCLLRAAEGDSYRVARCGWCRLWWFTAGKGAYCERPAPGYKGHTCRQAAAMRTYRKRQRKGK
jgi:hypothetical protein